MCLSACVHILNWRQQAIPFLFGFSSPERHLVGASVSAGCHCEVGFLSGLPADRYTLPDSIFRFRRRLYENQEQFNAVFLVPAGIGAEIGGHAGDATPAAKTLAAICDQLIVHPNVVNASDINEMSANMQYVEGSIVSRLLMGAVSSRACKKQSNFNGRPLTRTAENCTQRHQCCECRESGGRISMYRHCATPEADAHGSALQQFRPCNGDS